MAWAFCRPRMKIEQACEEAMGLLRCDARPPKRGGPEEPKCRRMEPVPGGTAQPPGAPCTAEGPQATRYLRRRQRRGAERRPQWAPPERRREAPKSRQAGREQP